MLRLMLKVYYHLLTFQALPAKSKVKRKTETKISLHTYQNLIFVS